MRRQSLLEPSTPMAPEKRGPGEVAGGATAECVAVVCCCPCTVVNMVILALYKVPTGLCRKAWKKRKNHRLQKKKSALQPTLWRSHSFNESDIDRDERIHNLLTNDNGSPSATTVDSEPEMLGQIYGGGFWRCPSPNL
ncbi:hypothetical protein NMG60_11033498 [Bertholletia excelsa]